MAILVSTTDEDVRDEPRQARAVAIPQAASSAAGWSRSYARALVVSDFAVIALALAVATIVGSQPYTLPLLHGGAAVSVWSVVGLIGVILLAALSMSGSRNARVVGVGTEEYRAILYSCFFSFASVALVAYLASLAGLHFILLVGLGSTAAGLLLTRWASRRWLVAQRREGRMSDRVLVVGSEASVAQTARDLQRTPAAGLRVVGACTPSGRIADYIPGTEIPVSGSVSNVIEALGRVQADTVLISSANELSARTVRELSWALEPGRQHLIVAPSLTDIGGPRLHTRPVAGLPLVHVETPRYGGGKLYGKRAFDVVASGLLILLLAPILAAIALAVKLTSPGGAFFRQQRIGLGGETFDMLKFRSMYTDAEERLRELAFEARDRGNDVMFKMKDDPRVTRAGKFLRRFSLDELPQLFNVFLGEMSLVGPRPPLEREVQQYSQSVHRRFLVKPGITGLWQVSGRSDLDWEETVRLDLFYVENWTMTGDLVILLKTVRAVIKSEGAY
ncbi:sugar transferase [Microbacterium sp. 4R-513]|uniref:sugar transferase n=1 Tax=Microbacterium sp. 4R-513 TaxID=2567934 RepID=UPI0013E14861|nr:sugar transferase [Microbacterium sp. 4R-513]QIG38536.1 sugar transferase [Microbacterium sp. 4R-513]